MDLLNEALFLILVPILLLPILFVAVLPYVLIKSHLESKKNGATTIWKEIKKNYTRLLSFFFERAF